MTYKIPNVIVDAIGVTKSLKTSSSTLITKPQISLYDLAMSVMMGASDSDTVSSLAGRLARLSKQLDEKEQQSISGKSGGIPLSQITGNLLNAIHGDSIEQKAQELSDISGTPLLDDEQGDALRGKAQQILVREAASVFTGDLIELLDSIRRDKEQTILYTPSILYILSNIH